MKRSGFGLRTTIVVNISLVMLITMLLIGFVVITLAKKTIYDTKVETAENILRSLQHLIVPTFKTIPGKNTTLNKLVEDYAQLHKLESIVLVDTSLNVLAATKSALSDSHISKEYVEKVIHSGNRLTEIKATRGGKYLSIVAPLSGDQVVLGAIRIRLSLADVEEAIAHFQKTVMLFSISTAIVFIVVGSFLLTRYLVKPLERLIEATEDITEGYVPKQLESTGSNEIGALSVSLARMSDKLREDKDKIDTYVKSLEESNTQLKQAQDEVIRSEKLSSVGRLAAGVAHEIGNPIGIILGYVEILRQQVSEGPHTNEPLERLEKEVMRIDTIIRELLSFSRPTTVSLQPIQANAVIKEATTIISHQKGFQGIKLKLVLDEALPTIMADERLLQQLFINLLINAMDAMPEGGDLSVSTEYRSVSNHGPLDYTLPQDGVTILVSDSGVGIEQKHLEKIFDPFYTTKSPGKGTGLGLSVCHRIIESLGGVIRVQSIPGKGTTFAVILPVSQESSNTIKHSA
jgi:signal transduction histidine kinase